MVVAIVSIVVGAFLGALITTGILNLGYEIVKRASQRKGTIGGFWGQLFGDTVVEGAALEEQSLPPDTASSREELNDELAPKIGFPLTVMWREGQYFPQGQQIGAMLLGALPGRLMEAALTISEPGGIAQPTPPTISLLDYDTNPILAQQRH